MEENVLAGGFGSAVLELFDAKGLSGIQLEMVGIPDEFVEHASQAEMRRRLRHRRGGDPQAARKLAGPAKPALREVVAK